MTRSLAGVWVRASWACDVIGIPPFCATDLHVPNVPEEPWQAHREFFCAFVDAYRDECGEPRPTDDEANQIWNQVVTKNQKELESEPEYSKQRRLIADDTWLEILALTFSVLKEMHFEENGTPPSSDKMQRCPRTTFRLAFRYADCVKQDPDFAAAPIELQLQRLIAANSDLGSEERSAFFSSPARYGREKSRSIEDLLVEHLVWMERFVRMTPWRIQSRDAENIVQDVILKTLEGGIPNNVRDHKAWLAKVLKHRTIDVLRQRGRRNLTPHMPDLYHRNLTRQSRRELLRTMRVDFADATKRLSEHEQEVLRYSALGCSYTEIANRLGISRHKVSEIFKSSEARLKKQLE